MARGVAVRVVGLEAVERALTKHNIRTNPRILQGALLESAFKIQRLAARKYIHHGGKAPPLPKKLTSRTGRLRGSIAVDRGDLPSAIEIGSHVVYAPPHELGLGRMPPRPFLQPATNEVQPQIPDIIVKHWSRETFS